MKVSDLYGKEIFLDNGKFLGTVQEVIVDLEKGVILRLLLEQLPSSTEKAKEVLRNKSIMYSNVSSVSDVIIVKAANL
jgi:sporulation protein YlmC with PRC-barrel domain